MRNIKLTIAYDGTNYHGFQVQARTKEPTIQGVLEERLTLLTKEEVKITGAGRTDAGVHARGQVVNFHTSANIPIQRFVQAVNSVMPVDIVALQAIEVPEDFHARFSAIGKVYSYTIYYSKIPSVFERYFSYQIPYHLDIDNMKKAAGFLIGEHDFSSFRASGSEVKSSIRKIERIDIDYHNPIIKLTFEADGFLYNMVRIITGTLIEIGRGKIAPEELKDIIAACDRDKAGPTAPAKGLCLEQVIYYADKF